MTEWKKIVASVSYNDNLNSTHKRAVWDNNWPAKLEKARYVTLSECAAWNALIEDLWKLPQSFLADEKNRKKLESYGFKDLPIPVVVPSYTYREVLIDCGIIPPDWSVKIVGPPYRRRIHWKDPDDIVRIVVTHYPEPWRYTLHARAC